MARVIPQRELRNNNAKLIDAVIAGETFIVTRNGQEVAELAPRRRLRRAFVPRSEIAEMATPTRHLDSRGFRGDLDRILDQTL